MEGFELISATGVGYYLPMKKSQDALERSETNERILGVICDGSSAHPRSEIGAMLAARITLRVLSEIKGDKIAQSITNALDQQLGPLAAECPDFFVFNFVAMRLDRESATILRLGDGIVMIEGAETKRGPRRHFDFENLANNQCEQWTIPIRDFSNVAIASYGASEFYLRHSMYQADGERLGKLEDTLKLNQEQLARKLRSAQQAFTNEGTPRCGIFQDDVSIIVARRI